MNCAGKRAGEEGKRSGLRMRAGMRLVWGDVAPHPNVEVDVGVAVRTGTTTMVSRSRVLCGHNNMTTLFGLKYASAPFLFSRAKQGGMLSGRCGQKRRERWRTPDPT